MRAVAEVAARLVLADSATTILAVWLWFLKAIMGR
jgi:hypothetical protein